jgi:hypothetical protein
MYIWTYDSSRCGSLNLEPMRRWVKPYLDCMLSWRGQGQIYLYINFILQVYQLSKHTFAPNILSPLEHVCYYVYSLLKVINVCIFSTDLNMLQDTFLPLGTSYCTAQYITRYSNSVVGHVLNSCTHDKTKPPCYRTSEQPELSTMELLELQ